MMRALFIAYFLCVSVPALAQGADPGPTDEDKSQAKRLVGEAKDAFTAGDFDTCAKKFSTAFKLAPLPQIQFNLALCYERLDRYRDAALEYEAAAKHKDMPAPMQEKANESLAKMRKSLAKVEIVGTTGKAVVDESISCDLPCSLYLEAGRHVVTYGADERKGFRAKRNEELVVTLEGGVKETPIQDRGFRATEGGGGNEREDLTMVSAKGSSGSNSAPGFLTWGGGGLAVAGTAGALVFGLRARSLHDDFQAMPTRALADDGDQMRNLTNLSIGVAVVGASLVVYDLLSD